MPMEIMETGVLRQHVLQEEEGLQRQHVLQGEGPLRQHVLREEDLLHLPGPLHQPASPDQTFHREVGPGVAAAIAEAEVIVVEAGAEAEA